VQTPPKPGPRQAPDQIKKTLLLAILSALPGLLATSHASEIRY